MDHSPKLAPSYGGKTADPAKDAILGNPQSSVCEAPQTLPLCSLSIRGTFGQQPNVIETFYDILKISHHGSHSPNPDRWSPEYWGPEGRQGIIVKKSRVNCIVYFRTQEIKIVLTFVLNNRKCNNNNSQSH